MNQLLEVDEVKRRVLRVAIPFLLLAPSALLPNRQRNGFLPPVGADPSNHFQHEFRQVDFDSLCRSFHYCIVASDSLFRRGHRDRVVQAALRRVLEPIFERDFAEQSYGFRPGRGCQAALARVTRRTNGRSLQAILADMNRTLQGWFGYFRHSHYTTFEPLDKWVRMRLRSILRKRQKKRGRGRGPDHQRWPNDFFAKLGLYTSNTA